jgi:hypothetical protein
MLLGAGVPPVLRARVQPRSGDLPGCCGQARPPGTRPPLLQIRDRVVCLPPFFCTMCSRVPLGEGGRGVEVRNVTLRTSTPAPNPPPKQSPQNHHVPRHIIVKIQTLGYGFLFGNHKRNLNTHKKSIEFHVF